MDVGANGEIGAGRLEEPLEGKVEMGEIWRYREGKRKHERERG